MNFVIEEMEKESGVKVGNNPRALRRLRTACEHAKIALTSQFQTVLNYEMGDDEFTTILTRAKFEELCMSLFVQCIECVKSAIEDSKISKYQIDEIVIVGGSSRIPKCQQMLVDFFDGKTLNQTVNPDEAVAHGATI